MSSPSYRACCLVAVAALAVCSKRARDGFVSKGVLLGTEARSTRVHLVNTESGRQEFARGVRSALRTNGTEGGQRGRQTYTGVTWWGPGGEERGKSATRGRAEQNPKKVVRWDEHARAAVARWGANGGFKGLALNHTSRRHTYTHARSTRMHSPDTHDWRDGERGAYGV
jgi:hypothetical protein